MGLSEGRLGEDDFRFWLTVSGTILKRKEVIRWKRVKKGKAEGANWKRYAPKRPKNRTNSRMIRVDQIGGAKKEKRRKEVDIANRAQERQGSEVRYPFPGSERGKPWDKLSLEQKESVARSMRSPSKESLDNRRDRVFLGNNVDTRA